MKIAIYGIKFSESFAQSIQYLLDILHENGAELVVFEHFESFLNKHVRIPGAYATFTEHSFSKELNVLLSIGGDGTILDAVTLVKDSNVPILGINTGRLGFLSNVSREEIENAVKALLNNEYTVEERSLVALHSEEDLFGDKSFALNELTVIKKDTSSMISVQAYIDGAYLNTYWGDGLIVSTPTGSTAYSLSCGGPILVPSAANFVLTPIAPHNLNVRPIVVSDASEIVLKVERRDENFLVALDSRIAVISPMLSLHIRKANFTIKLIRMHQQDFFQTLRNKLMWGVDKRN